MYNPNKDAYQLYYIALNKKLKCLSKAIRQDWSQVVYCGVIDYCYHSFKSHNIQNIAKNSALGKTFIMNTKATPFTSKH